MEGKSDCDGDLPPPITQVLLVDHYPDGKNDGMKLSQTPADFGRRTLYADSE